MSDQSTSPMRRRAPQVFDATDPALIVEPGASTARDEPGTGRPVQRPQQSPAGTAAVEAAAVAGDEDVQAPRKAQRNRPGWLALLVSALLGLAVLAATVAFAEFVSVVLARSDWIGLAGWSLLGLAVLAGVVLASRELFGLMRLQRLARLRRDAEAVVRVPDITRERDVVARLRRAYSSRADLAWAASRFAEHERDVRDPGDLLALADRELVLPLDGQARRLVLASAKRVSLVTAMSPIAALAVGFVVVENLRMLRALATLYGGRPGVIGGFKLARMVFVHILATGGIALTDDLIGQFIGQDLARRLSRRLGEGLFNGALTARVGVAALEICRPLPFIEATPVRVRDILAELTRRAAPAGK